MNESDRREEAEKQAESYKQKIDDQERDIYSLNLRLESFADMAKRYELLCIVLSIFLNIRCCNKPVAVLVPFVLGVDMGKIDPDGPAKAAISGGTKISHFCRKTQIVGIKDQCIPYNRLGDLFL